MLYTRRLWQPRTRQARGQNCETVAGCLHGVAPGPTGRRCTDGLILIAVSEGFIPIHTLVW